MKSCPQSQNPPFSLLLGDDIEKLFDNVSSGAPGRTILEQLLSFATSQQYEPTREIVLLVAKKAKALPFGTQQE